MIDKSGGESYGNILEDTLLGVNGSGFGDGLWWALSFEVLIFHPS